MDKYHGDSILCNLAIHSIFLTRFVQQMKGPIEGEPIFGIPGLALLEFFHLVLHHEAWKIEDDYWREN